MRWWWLACLALAVESTGAAPAPRADLLVDGAWLAAHLDDPEVTLVHVAAEPAGYQRGHLPGARFLPLAVVAASRDGLHNEFPPAADLVAAFRGIGLANAGRIVLYGEDTGIAAARAYVALDYLGAGDRAALLDGGLSQWRAAGRPTSTASPRVEPGTFMATPRPERLVSRQAVQDIATAGSPGIRLVDVRSPEAFAAGHIGGSANVFWGAALTSPTAPTLRPAAELRALYDKAGLGADGTVLVCYCNSGMQASLGYFMARYLGYDARLYDGSLADWTAAGLPVERG